MRQFDFGGVKFGVSTNLTMQRISTKAEGGSGFRSVPDTKGKGFERVPCDPQIRLLQKDEVSTRASWLG